MDNYFDGFPPYDKNSEVMNSLQLIDNHIKDAEQDGLVAEVVLYALQYMKSNPHSSIEDAMNYGYYEWIK
jgi:hypothetical protein